MTSVLKRKREDDDIPDDISKVLKVDSSLELSLFVLHYDIFIQYLLHGTKEISDWDFEEEFLMKPNHFTHTYQRETDVLNLALACRLMFKTYSKIINSRFHFHCMSSGPFCHYQPTQISIIHKESAKFIPISATRVSINADCENIPLLPPNIKILSTNSHKIISLPPSLSQLSMGGSKLTNFQLPSCLTHLSWQFYFSMDFANCILPTTLTHLKLYGTFTNLTFPPFLQHLFIECRPFSQIPQVPKFPDSLTHLRIHYIGETPMPVLPNNLQLLEIIGQVPTLPSLPPSLKFLIIPMCDVTFESYPPNLEYLDDHRNNAPFPPFPSSLKTLKIRNHPGPLPPLPSSITELYTYPEILPQEIPSTVTHLTLIDVFSDSVKIPPTVTHLKIQLVTSKIPSLPDSLTHLIISANSNTTLPTNYPPNLVYLSIRPKGKMKSFISNFPPSLIYLEIPASKDPLPSLPKNLQVLKVSFDDFIVEPIPPLPPSLHSLALKIPENSSYIPPWNEKEKEKETEKENEKEKEKDGKTINLPNTLFYFVCNKKWFEKNNVGAQHPTCYFRFG